VNTETAVHPARQSRIARLVEVGGSRVFPLQRKIVLVGSSPLCSVQLADPGIQEQHAYLLERNGNWFVKPILARCQCRINGASIHDEAPIADADELALQGSVVFRFQTRDETIAPARRTTAPQDPAELHESFLAMLRCPDLRSSLEHLVVGMARYFQADRATVVHWHPDGASGIRAAFPTSDAQAASRIQVLIPTEEQNTTLALKPIDHPGPSRAPAETQGPESVLSAPLGASDFPGWRLFLILERDAGRPPFSAEEVASLESFRALVVEILNRVRDGRDQAERLARSTSEPAIDASLIHQSASLCRVADQARSCADLESPLLIHGEPGSGQEAWARRIHAWSGRREAPFLAIPCGSGTHRALAVELFGAEVDGTPGAIGAWTRARGGTLLLKSLDRLPPDLQGRLAARLRTPPASGDDSPRLVATIEGDLDRKGSDLSLDESLLALFEGPSLEIPPLRERPDDLLLMATHILRQAAFRLGLDAPKLGHKAERWLLAQPWRRNVEELERVLQNACVRCDGPTLRPEHLQPGASPRKEDAPGPEDPRIVVSLEAAREAAERTVCTQALARTRGNVVKAADLLATDRRTLQRVLERIDLDPRSFREGARSGIPAS